MRAWAPLAALFVLLAQSALSAEILVVIAENANVREGPGTSFEVKWVEAKYMPLSVLERIGRWVHVRDIDGDDGWLHRNLLSATSGGVVRTARANVRFGPGRNHDVAWTVERGYSFRVVDRQGDWLRVQDDEGTDGWLHRSVAWGILEADPEDGFDSV